MLFVNISKFSGATPKIIFHQGFSMFLIRIFSEANHPVSSTRSEFFYARRQREGIEIFSGRPTATAAFSFQSWVFMSSFGEANHIAPRRIDRFLPRCFRRGCFLSRMELSPAKRPGQSAKCARVAPETSALAKFEP